MGRRAYFDLQGAAAVQLGHSLDFGERYKVAILHAMPRIVNASDNGWKTCLKSKTCFGLLAFHLHSGQHLQTFNACFILILKLILKPIILSCLILLREFCPA